MITVVSRLAPILRRSKLVSANLTIGTATSFVLCAAVLGLVMERPLSPVGAGDAIMVESDLLLRGTLAPNDEPWRHAPAESRPSGTAIIARL